MNRKQRQKISKGLRDYRRTTGRAAEDIAAQLGWTRRSAFRGKKGRR